MADDDLTLANLGRSVWDFLRTSYRAPDENRIEGGRPADPNFADRFVGNALTSLATLPQRAFEASNRLMLTGEYDPAPIMETALTLTTGGMPHAMRGAVGSAGGKVGGPSALPMDDAACLKRADDMGFRRTPVAFSVAPAGEIVGQPAAKVGNQVFTGVNHPDALETASRSLRIPFDTLADRAIDGFTTSAGRFVSRHEALEIARRADQRAAGHPSARGLTSAQLKKEAKVPPDSFHTGATASGLPGGEGVWGRYGVERPGVEHPRSSPTQAATLWHRTNNPARLNASGATDHALRAALAEAWERGHDAVLMQNYIRPGGRKPETVLVVRDLNQLRSPNAAFDPAKKGSSDILAGVAGVAAGTGAMLPDATPQSETVY